MLQATTSVVNDLTHGNVLQWDTDGYYLFGEDTWQDIDIEVSIVYKGGTIGVFPKFYTPFHYVLFTAGKEVVSDEEGVSTSDYLVANLEAYVNDSSVKLADTKKDIVLTEGTAYTVRAVVTRYNYQIFFDGVQIYNVEYGGITSGNAGVFATTSNQCISMEAKSTFPDQWTSNVSSINEAVVSLESAVNEDGYVYMKNPSTTSELYSEQIVGAESISGDFAFSAKYKGDIVARVVELDGTLAGTAHEVIAANSSTWRVIELQGSISTDCTSIAIRMVVPPGMEGYFNDVQLEDNKYATSYIHNNNLDTIATRDSSIITYPGKDVFTNVSDEQGGISGSISMWIKPNVTYDSALGEQFALFQYGPRLDGIGIYGVGDSIHIQHGATTTGSYTGLPLPLTKDNWYHIALTWEDTQMSLFVNGSEQPIAVSDLYSGDSNVLRIGGDVDNVYDVFNGMIDDVIVYNKQLSKAEVINIFESQLPVPQTGDMTLRATFNYAIANFEKTYIEIPNSPDYGSPVLVEKEDGQELRKVSFVNFLTGEYRTWNEEIVIYEGDDYIEVSFYGLDLENFQIGIRDSDGGIVGDPYSVDGKRINMILTDDQKEKYLGEPFHVRYQLKDSYTVDYNIQAADSFRVDLAKHDGQKIKVVYEGNRFSQEKLADMIELNPLLNPNHQGFLYVTQNKETITSFKVKVTPHDLPADGASDALIVIEPIDKDGNHVCSADLEVFAELGTVVPAIDPDSVRLREISGRYLYRYYPKLLKQSEQKGLPEITDKIKIRDKETGIGVQKHITLVLSDYYKGEPQEDNESINKLTTISNQLMAAELMLEMVKYFYQPTSNMPDGLGPILDLNGDAYIDMDDFSWLSDKLHTTDLKDKYDELQAWKKNNQ